MRNVQRDVEDAVPYGADPRSRAADYPSASPTPGGVSPSPTGTDGRGAKPTWDVEDAVPYGMVRKCRRGAQTAGGASPSPTGWCEAVRWLRICGTSRTPSPTGWCEKAGVVRRPREGQAPPLRDGAKPWGGCVSAGRRGRRPLRDGADGRGYGIAGGASPAPTGTDGRGAKPTRDIEDAVPCGMVRVYGLPKGKAERLGIFVMFFLTFLLTKSKFCCTLSLGRRSRAPRRRILRGVVPGDFFARHSPVRIIPFENYPFSRISGDSPLFPPGRADLLPVPPPIR